MESQRDSFGMRNFGRLDLGDKRRTARLVDTVDIMCRHPGGTLPDKLNRPAALAPSIVWCSGRKSLTPC